MGPWIETVGIIIVALLGISVGRGFSRLRRPYPYWIAGYLLSLGLITTLIIIRYGSASGFVPTFCWFAMGQVKFFILSLAVTIGLTAPLSHLRYKFERVLTFILMIVIVGWFCILPVFAPAMIREELSNIQTTVDSEGVCRQSKDYTCGPAAAVTALGKLGLAAEEGEIAILSRSSPVVGTLPWCLYSALQQRYEAEGLRCRLRYFDSIAQLKNAGITLAVVRDSFMSDHCVAVLEVSEKEVRFADPVVGRISMTHEQFEKIWRFSGIVLRRDSAQRI